MFYERPKTINDCTKRDPRAEKITGFASTVETIGSVVMWVIFICGLIIAIISGRDSDGDFSFGLFLAEYIPWIIIGIFELLVYKFFSYLLTGVGEIVQNTRETANFALLQATNEHENSTQPNVVNKVVETVKSDKTTKICPSCGNKSVDNLRFCPKCGAKYEQTNDTAKVEAAAVQIETNKLDSKEPDETGRKKVTQYIGDDRLVCPYCGREQMRSRYNCYNCGKGFIKG